MLTLFWMNSNLETRKPYLGEHMLTKVQRSTRKQSGIYKYWCKTAQTQTLKKILISVCRNLWTKEKPQLNKKRRRKQIWQRSNKMSRRKSNQLNRLKNSQKRRRSRQNKKMLQRLQKLSRHLRISRKCKFRKTPLTVMMRMRLRKRKQMRRLVQKWLMMRRFRQRRSKPLKLRKLKLWLTCQRQLPVSKKTSTPWERTTKHWFSIFRESPCQLSKATLSKLKLRSRSCKESFKAYRKLRVTGSETSCWVLARAWTSIWRWCSAKKKTISIFLKSLVIWDITPSCKARWKLSTRLIEVLIINVT